MVSEEAQFTRLLEEWRETIRPSTRLHEMLEQPAYRQIVQLGLLAKTQVLRLILADLSQHPRHWFQALAEISGTNPVPASATSFADFRAAWLAWGAAQGLV